MPYMSIEAPASAFPNLWCVYYVYLKNQNDNWEIWYMGKSKLCDVTFFTDAQRNSEWMKHYHPNRELRLTIVDVYPTELAAYNAFASLIRVQQPHCNVRGYDISAPGGSLQRATIQCNETGEQFRSIAEIIRKYGGTQSAYSRHLKALPGYRSVKGHTYRYLI